jgi:osmotically-inducible protein OsmY
MTVFRFFAPSLTNACRSAHRSALLAVALATMAVSLPACLPLVVGGAMLGGGLVATDRRTSGAILEDEGIELRSGSRLRDALGERAHINVTSYNRQALLTGEVGSEKDKDLAGQVVSKVDNVQKIVNELEVTGYTSSFSQRSSDVLISGKVKAAFVDAKDIFANSFKVVTEHNIVYLMGRVTPREADRATDIARSIGGVQKVVRIFELITEEDLTRTLPQVNKPATPASAP